MKTAKQLREEIRTQCERVTAIATLAEVEARDLKDDETKEIDAIQGVGDNPGIVAALQKDLDRAEKLEKIQASLALKQGERKLDEQPVSGVKAITVPARAKAEGKVKNFKTEEEAYGAGQFYLAVLGHGDSKKRAQRWCKEHGYVKNALSTGDNTKGGFLVPEPLAAQIIILREKYGIFRQYASQVTMPDAVMLIPKLNGEITTYFVGEGDPTANRNVITPSDIALAQIKLEARKLASLTVMSSEISEDAIISIADILTGSIAYQVAYTEDNCGFNGDGTSTYGMIKGVGPSLAAGSVVTGAGTTFSALTMANFETAVGQRRMWAGSTPSWYISQVGWANSMQRLMDAYSGNTVYSIADGAPKFQFLGFPVVISQVLTKATSGTTGQFAAFFGDLSQGVYMGSRRGLEVQADKSLYFNYDAIAVRATERFDINVHDVGDATNAGGIIGVKFA
jgi:hypothetical protein